jgi:hypothetical protein
LRRGTPASVQAIADDVPMGATTIVKEKPVEAAKKLTGEFAPCLAGISSAHILNAHLSE